jgi:hypothetical protein
MEHCFETLFQFTETHFLRATMTSAVTYSRTDLVSSVVMDDGRVSVFSSAMLRSLHEAFDRRNEMRRWSS